MHYECIRYDALFCWFNLKIQYNEMMVLFDNNSLRVHMYLYFHPNLTIILGAFWFCDSGALWYIEKIQMMD